MTQVYVYDFNEFLNLNQSILSRLARHKNYNVVHIYIPQLVLSGEGTCT